MLYLTTSENTKAGYNKQIINNVVSSHHHEQRIYERKIGDSTIDILELIVARFPKYIHSNYY